jgi:plastocyanin
MKMLWCDANGSSVSNQGNNHGFSGSECQPNCGTSECAQLSKAASGPYPKLDVNPAVVFPAGGNSFDGSAFTSSSVIADNIPVPQTYALTLTKPGTYIYVCLIHTAQYPDGSRSPMVGTVTVVAADADLPMTPAQVDAAAQQDIAGDAALATSHEHDATSLVPPDAPGPNGTTIHHVSAGYIMDTPDKDQVDLRRFNPEVLTINQGDTVVWSSPTDHLFHNVLFGEPNAHPINVEPQPQGPLKATAPFEVFFPVGGPVKNGSGTYSAGIIVGPQDAPNPFTTSYSLTFNTPGTYNYICGLHGNQGMKGTIIVRARIGSTPGMPRTGDAGNMTGVWLTALLVALSGVSGGLWLRRAYKVRKSS